jgi:thiamine pyrophosphokinase
MKTRCVIIAGGDFSDKHTLLLNRDKDFVIAADSGYGICKHFNIIPDLIVGDFDSFTGLLPKGIKIHKLPVHKDDTDLLYAARCGVNKGFNDYLVLGGYGSRPDQCFAMYQTLLWIAENKTGAKVSAFCNGFEVYLLLNCSMTFSLLNDRYLSIFSMYDRSFGVNIKGNAEYPLENATLSNGFPIGVSNVTTNGEITVSVEKGALLIMTVDKNI